VQRRHRDEEARTPQARAAAPGTRASRVHRDAGELEPEHFRGRAQAGESERFCEHALARSRERREHDEERVLRAARHEDLLRLRGKTARAHPRGTGAAVARLARVRREVEARSDVGIGGERAQRQARDLVEIARHR
jgi:hypothetical protein